MTELKPCPFCGSAAHIAKNYKGNYTVECDNYLYCIASKMVFWDYEEDAVEAWNRRPEDEQRN